MSTTTLSTTIPVPGTELPRGAGLPGKVTAAFASAGGILGGGFLIAFLTLTERMSGHLILGACTIFFILGSALGLAHGIAVAYLGRPAETTSKEAWSGIALGVLYSVPALAASFVAAGWIAMTVASLHSGHMLAALGTGIGWAAGAAIVAVAGWLKIRALRNLIARWPEWKKGSLILAATLIFLVAGVVAWPPVVFGMALTPVAAVIAAVLVTLWLAGPAVALGLRAFARLGDRGIDLMGVIAAIVAGVVFAGMAFPFYRAPIAVPFTGQVALGTFGRLVAGEAILRLFVVSVLAFGLIRRYNLRRPEAALLAIVGAAALEVVLRLPAVLAIGFPSALVLVAYVAFVVLIPAIVTGLLFWKRGYTAAVLADVVAVAVLALLAR